MDVDNDPFIIALSDLLTNDETMPDQYMLFKMKSRADWWAWMEREYGAVKAGLTMSKRFGYGSVAVKFPNRSSYMRYCLTWM